jgi:hypothetical protein
MYYAYALVVVAIGCFIAGILVYRNNSKKLGALTDKIDSLPVSVKAVLKKYGVIE